MHCIFFSDCALLLCINSQCVNVLQRLNVHSFGCIVSSCDLLKYMHCNLFSSNTLYTSIQLSHIECMQTTGEWTPTVPHRCHYHRSLKIDLIIWRSWADTAIPLVIVSPAQQNTLVMLQHFSRVSSVCPYSPPVFPFNWASTTHRSQSSPMMAHTPSDSLPISLFERELMLMKFLSAPQQHVFFFLAESFLMRCRKILNGPWHTSFWSAGGFRRGKD